MNNGRFISTPRHCFTLDTRVMHASSYEEAALHACEQWLKTGVEWEVFETRGCPDLPRNVVQNLINRDKVHLMGETA